MQNKRCENTTNILIFLFFIILKEGSQASKHLKVNDKIQLEKHASSNYDRLCHWSASMWRNDLNCFVFTVLQWPPKSPQLNPIEHLWHVVERDTRTIDVQPTNLRQYWHAIMSIWTKISEECSLHLMYLIPNEVDLSYSTNVGSDSCV